MIVKDNRKEKAAELRSQAEAKLSGRKRKAAPSPATESDTRRLVNELEVHQIELETQNEELVQARAEVEALLSQYTDLYDFAPVGYFTLARDGAIHQVNLAGATLLGVERGALIKRRFGLFVSVESRPIFNTFLEKVFSTRGSKEACQVTLLKDRHKPLWVHIEATCIEDGQECRAVVSDITELKRAEKALSDSEMRYRRLFETAKDGILILNAETGMVVDVNPFLINMLGYSHEQFVGKQIWELGLLKDVVANWDKFAELQRQEYIRYEDLPLVTGDGRQIDVEFISNVYSVDHKKVIQCNIRNITERKKAEDRLSVSEVRYRRLFESAQDGILILDAETGMVVDVNPFLVKMLGYSHEQFVGKQIWKLGCLKDIIANRDKFAELQRQEYIRYEDLPLVTGDGRQIDVEFISNVYLVEHTKVIQCNIRNITERKRAEEALKKYQDNLEELVAERTEALQESENNFRRSQDDSPLGIRIITAGGDLLYANQAILDIYGYDSVEELEATPHRKNYTPESYDEHQVRVEKRRRGEYVPPNYEISIVRKDGKVRHLEVFRKEVLWNGEPQFQVLYNDITDRKRAGEALWASEKKYRQLIETLQEGIWVIDKDTNTTFVNPRMAEMLGYTIEEMLGKPLFSFMDERGVEIVKYNMERRKQGIAEQHDFEFLRKDGSRIYATMETSPMTDEKGNFVGALAGVVDITERKRADAKRLELERKYLISSRLASIGEMAAGIAHEINNPLSPIIGFADLLLKEDLPEAIKADIQIIRDCANRAANVTKGLLVFARQNKPMRKLYSINELVETTIQLRIYHLKTSNIMVIKELDPELPKTMVDAAQMQQVLLNLIMNAEYAMNKAHVGGNLTIKTEKKENIIRVLVKDDGQGISSENMDKLFQPFFTTKKVGEGTGLGLSVCHGIVAEHNGRIYAESDEGNGATFIVELPILRQEEDEATEPSEPDAGEAEETVAARILVVDDEPSITQVLKRVLTAEGYEVETTNKAGDALNLIKGGKSYALILLDIKLPDMNGIELYQHLSKIANSLTRRIIFVTGDVLGTDTMDFFSRTRASYITKPFDIEQLKKDVKSKLTQKV